MTDRNYDTISPSARSLLYMKGHTNIPFARRAAELLEPAGTFVPDFNKRDMTFWARVVHFETRYWSIDQLLSDAPAANILELSSGFSFRGLEAVTRRGVHYIDTDLPDVIAAKREIVSALLRETAVQGTMELLPLNALDKDRFDDVVSRFPPGPIAIINEGLLMYLDMEEKERLSTLVHTALRKRGGYWVTADVYVRRVMGRLELTIDEKTKEFFERHRIEENKFADFREAAAFFSRMGFSIDKEARVERANLSALKYLFKSASLKELLRMRRAGKIQATWRLRAR